MNMLPLILSMLLHKKSRSLLTILSVAVAFVLFGVLNSLTSAITVGARMVGADRLIVTSRVGLSQPVPYTHRSQIEAVPGVAAVNPIGWLGASFQDPKNAVAAMAVDPKTVFSVDPTLLVSPEQKSAFQASRTGILVGKALAEKYGWRVGDHISLITSWAKKDGNANWDFEIVGLYALDESLLGQKVAANALLANYDYFDSARKYTGEVNWFGVRANDASTAADVARQIDNLFLTGSAQTRTQSEYEMASGFLRQFGDVGLMTTSILIAVFISITLVVANTMMQAYKARRKDIAVLKTLGFSELTLALVSFSESILLSLIGAICGLAIAERAVHLVQPIVLQSLPGFQFSWGTVTGGLLLASCIALLANALPVWQTNNMSVVAALKRH